MPLSRRRFLQQTALASFIFPALVRGQNLNSKLQLVQIGCGGKGGDDIQQIGSHAKVRYVGFCDVDKNRFGAANATNPGVAHFSDYREMFEKLGSQFDAAVISTPDHMHALPALRAMRLRKHVYLQKPLAHSIAETRALQVEAKQNGVRTQMGIQIHSNSEYRTAVSLIRSGRIGKIKAIHSWQANQGNQWTQRTSLPDPATAPANLDWDLWLGGAAERPYANGVYHPANWRDWKDFGGGTLGDFGCHILDPVFTAIGLTAPISVIAENSGVNPQTWSASQTVHYVFPGTSFTTEATLPVTWYDGGRQPDPALAKMPAGMNLPREGSLFVGEEGTVILPHVGNPMIFPVEKFGVTLSPGDATRRKRKLAAGEKDERKVAEIEVVEARNHYHDWVDAALGGPETTANFAYAGPLTEAVLIGTIATQVPGSKLVWDQATMRITNNEQAQALVSKPYRKGWTV